jgi:hypothetical protein
MKHFGLTRTVVIASMILGWATAAAPAQTVQAFNNATVQPTGPRMGAFGLAFFNVEGRPSGANASYGVIDFNSTGLGYSGGVTQVTSVTVALVQDEAGFSSRGAMNFYVTDDTTTSIANDGTSPLMFDPSDVEGLNGQLANTYLLGPAKFKVIRTGFVNKYTFAVDPTSALSVYLAGQINNGGTIRIVITPENDAADGEQIGATWAGYTNTAVSNPGPSLTVIAQ